MRLGGHTVFVGRVVEHGHVPVRDAVLGHRGLAVADAVEREERVPQDLKQPRPEVGSRLEPVGEPERAEVRLLDQVVGLGRAAREVQGKVVERIEMGQRVAFEVGVGAHQSRSHSSR